MDRPSGFAGLGMSAVVSDGSAASDYTPAPLDRDAPFYVAGHRGLVGSAIWRQLEASGFSDLIGRSSSELDLKDRDAVFSFFEETKPATVVLAVTEPLPMIDSSIQLDPRSKSSPLGSLAIEVKGAMTNAKAHSELDIPLMDRCSE